VLVLKYPGISSLTFDGQFLRTAADIEAVRLKHISLIFNTDSFSQQLCWPVYRSCLAVGIYTIELYC